MKLCLQIYFGPMTNDGIRSDRTTSLIESSLTFRISGQKSLSNSLNWCENCGSNEAIP